VVRKRKAGEPTTFGMTASRIAGASGKAMGLLPHPGRERRGGNDAAAKQSMDDLKSYVAAT